MGKKIDDLNPILSKIIRPVAAIKFLRFALCHHVVVDVALQCDTGKRHGFVFDGRKYTKDPFHEELMSS